MAIRHRDETEEFEVPTIVIDQPPIRAVTGVRRRPASIGVTPMWAKSSGRVQPAYQIDQPYADALLAVKGLPMMLAYAEDKKTLDTYLDGIDGLLVTGNDYDIPPEEYGQKARRDCGPTLPERTRFERALIEGALRRDLAILGICGGMQLLNVAMGGTLYQDIRNDLPEAMNHVQRTDRRKVTHSVNIRQGTRLAKAVGEGQLMVNSTHHQAVRSLGKGLSMSAVAADGVVEGVESDLHRFVLGVQWHPEALARSVPANLCLFRAFTRAAARSRG